MSGKNSQAIIAEMKDQEYNEFNWHFTSPNGETYEAVQLRYIKWLDEIKTIDQQHIIANESF